MGADDEETFAGFLFFPRTSGWGLLDDVDGVEVVPSMVVGVVIGILGIDFGALLAASFFNVDSPSDSFRLSLSKFSEEVTCAE